MQRRSQVIDTTLHKVQIEVSFLEALLLPRKCGAGPTHADAWTAESFGQALKSATRLSGTLASEIDQLCCAVLSTRCPRKRPEIPGDACTQWPWWIWCAPTCFQVRSTLRMLLSEVVVMSHTDALFLGTQMIHKARSRMTPTLRTSFCATTSLPKLLAQRADIVL